MKLLVALFVLFPLSCLGQVTNPLPNVIAWGDNRFGQCNIPQDLTNAIALAAGTYCSFALRSDGTLAGWGAMSAIPADLSNVVAIAASPDANGDHFIALKADDELRIWNSSNNYGEGTVPPGLTNIAAIAAQREGNIVLRTDGTVVSWGFTYIIPSFPPPDLTNAIAVAAAHASFAALRSDGRVCAWGYPFPLPDDLTNAVGLAGGEDFYLALRRDGRVIAWGHNSSRQLDVPADVTNVVNVAAGACHGLALRADGTLKAWGYNDYRQCNVPPDLPRVTSVAGGFLHTLALVEPNVAGGRPTILRAPNSQTLSIGSTAHFSVRAVGFPPLAYQWYFESNAIAGATNTSLVLTELTSAHAGAYTIIVTNGAGLSSRSATLSVLPGLTVNMVPAIALAGDVGQTYRLDYVNAIGATTDWQTLTTISITNTGQLFFDVSAIGEPKRFYRLVHVP